MKAELLLFWRVSLLLVTLVLTGCGAARYEADYNGFNSAYADSSNRQMLLNLARLDQHDPTYFLQFGQISVQYSFTGSINGTANNSVPQSTFHVPIVTEAAGLTAGASTTPSFTFIPVSDDKVAQELLNPVPPNVIYTLFQQGWPVDQLLRLMVERFEIKLPGDKTATTFLNSPERGNTKSYITFLKICAIAREFQRDGALKLLATEEFVPLAVNWTSATAPTATELLAADAKELTYQKDSDGKWELGRKELVPRFVLEQSGDATVARLGKIAVFGEGESLKNMRQMLEQGFSVEGSYKEKDYTGPRMVLRSFLKILASAAQEQTGFNNLIARTSLLTSIPPPEDRPILRLRWDNSTNLISPLIALDYHGQSYQVTDPVSEKDGEQANWNRDVFRLLTQLASQVSVDISKFPLPTSLQVLPSP